MNFKKILFFSAAFRLSRDAESVPYRMDFTGNIRNLIYAVMVVLSVIVSPKSYKPATALHMI